MIVTHPLVPEDNARLLALIGAIFDREYQADALARDMAAALAYAAGVAAQLPRERVLYLIWRKPWMTVTRATYVGATLACVGWDCVAPGDGKRYPSLADDEPAWRDAERILLSTEPYAFRERDAADIALQRQRPATLIDGEWTSWYGVRAIAGLRALAAFRADLAK